MKKKLTGIILLVSISILLAAIFLVVLYELRASKIRLWDDLRSFADLSGEYCRDLLDADNYPGVERSLSKLYSIPYIAGAVVYNRRAEPVAFFNRSGIEVTPPDFDRETTYGVSGDFIFVVQPINKGNNSIGNICLLAPRNEVNKKIAPYLIAMALIIAGLALAAYLLAQLLQNIISKPIISLLNSTINIGSTHEASLSVKKKRRNELALLRDRIDHLLEQVHIREVDIDKVVQTQKEVEELKESEEKYKGIFEHISLGIALYSAENEGEDFILVDLNSTAELTEHKHRADLMGKRITSIFPAVIEDGLFEVFQKVWRTGEPEYYADSRYFLTEDASWKDHYVFKLPSGQIGAAFIDVTQRKKADDESIASQLEAPPADVITPDEMEDVGSGEAVGTIQLTALNREMCGLFAAVANDLGNPLNEIDKFSMSFLQNYAGSLDDKGKNDLIQIRAASHRMTQLFKEVEHLSQISDGKLKVEDVDLSDLARKRVTELKEGNPSRKAEFIIADDIKVRGDSRLLALVMDNLFNNAWIYSGKKRKTKIEFGVVQTEDGREYFVRDNGIGFAAVDSELIFKPYFKLNPDEIYPGSGMGLALVRRIIHIHRGVIRAEAEPDKGASFYFTLGL